MSTFVHPHAIVYPTANVPSSAAPPPSLALPPTKRFRRADGAPAPISPTSLLGITTTTLFDSACRTRPPSSEHAHVPVRPDKRSPHESVPVKRIPVCTSTGVQRVTDRSLTPSHGQEVNCVGKDVAPFAHIGARRFDDDEVDLDVVTYVPARDSSFDPDLGDTVPSDCEADADWRPVEMGEMYGARERRTGSPRWRKKRGWMVSPSPDLYWTLFLYCVCHSWTCWWISS